MALLTPPQVIPLTNAPAQVVSISLGGQSCLINIYTKSINIPVVPPGSILSDPNPTFENTNPVFLNLFVNNLLVLGGIVVRNGSLMLMNTYLGFIGDLSVIDTSGKYEDPQGVPRILPPPDLRNAFQRSLPLWLEGYAPENIANTIPGLGTRWLLTYWPNLV